MFYELEFWQQIVVVGTALWFIGMAVIIMLAYVDREWEEENE